MCVATSAPRGAPERPFSSRSRRLCPHSGLRYLRAHLHVRPGRCAAEGLAGRRAVQRAAERRRKRRRQLLPRGLRARTLRGRFVGHVLASENSTARHPAAARAATCMMMELLERRTPEAQGTTARCNERGALSHIHPRVRSDRVCGRCGWDTVPRGGGGGAAKGRTCVRSSHFDGARAQKGAPRRRDEVVTRGGRRRERGGSSHSCGRGGGGREGGWQRCGRGGEGEGGAQRRRGAAASRAAMPRHTGHLPRPRHPGRYRCVRDALLDRPYLYSRHERTQEVQYPCRKMAADTSTPATPPGITYERHAIEKWLRKKGTCPATNAELGPGSDQRLVPNIAIKVNQLLGRTGKRERMKRDPKQLPETSAISNESDGQHLSSRLKLVEKNAGRCTPQTHDPTTHHRIHYCHPGGV